MAISLRFTRIIEGAKQVALRFPVTLVFWMALTIHILFLVAIEKGPNAWTFFFSVGMLLTLLLHLWAEEEAWLRIDVLQPKRTKAWLWWIGAIVLLAFDCYCLDRMAEVRQPMVVAQGVAVLALVIGVCFLPFRKEKDDFKSWNFVFRLFLAAAVSLLIGGIMAAGLDLLYYGATELLSLESNSKVFLDITWLSLISLPCLLFLIRIPEGEEKHNDRIPKSQFVLGVVRYLFLPLVLLYLVVLYVYGLKIVFTLTLPHGMLTILTSTLMVGLIGVAFLLYPYLHDERIKGYERSMMRWLPLAVLPVLVLMSIGLGRRFLDYGITANRLYVLTMNLWFYAVALGLFFGKIRRIHWISISATLILILTSCHPWNYNTLYEHHLLQRFDALVEKYPLPKSKNYDRLRDYLRSMPEEDSRAMFSVLSGLKAYDWRLYQEKTNKMDTPFGTYESYLGVEAKEWTPSDKYDMNYKYSGEDIPVPQGYHYVKEVSINCHKLTTASKASKEWDEGGYACNDSTFTYEFEGLGTAIIPHKGLDDDSCYVIPVKGDAVFVLTKLTISDYDNDSKAYKKSPHSQMTDWLEGYLYYNKK